MKTFSGISYAKASKKKATHLKVLSMQAIEAIGKQPKKTIMLTKHSAISRKQKF